jgi:hypothetical protein
MTEEELIKEIFKTENEYVNTLKEIREVNYLNNIEI